MICKFELSITKQMLAPIFTKDFIWGAIDILPLHGISSVNLNLILYSGMTKSSKMKKPRMQITEAEYIQIDSVREKF